MAKKFSRSAPAGAPALVALEHAGIPHTVHPYTNDPTNDLGYGLEAARAIGVHPAQVLKTLVAQVDGSLAVAVVLEHDVVHVSGGRRGLDVGLAPEELLRLTRGVAAPISRA